MDWNIGYTLWMFLAAFLTGWNVVAVLFQKKRYNYKIALFSVGFFCVALLEELRMFAQWLDHGELKLLEHALQTLPAYFGCCFLAVIVQNVILFAVDGWRNRKDKK